MKMTRFLFGALLCLFCLTATAQETVDRKWEIGLDLTPIVALPYSGSNNQPGLELAVRRKISDKGKLRFRYFNHREDSPIFHKDGHIFTTTPIEPATDGTPRFIANINYQEGNNGISIGYQKDFSINGMKMYYGMDVHGQISKGEVWSEILAEGEQPYPARGIFVFNVPEFEGVINRYLNYQFGIVPALGVDIPLGERINFSIEFGARIAYFQQNLPYVEEFGSVENIRSSGIFMEANPIKDIIIAFRF